MTFNKGTVFSTLTFEKDAFCSSKSSFKPGRKTIKANSDSVSVGVGCPD